MQGWKPLLQIIHISDLHLCDSYNAKAAKFMQSRGFRLIARSLVTGYDLLGWHEGTLRNDENAADCFEKFLRQMAQRERRWLGRADVPGTAQTWLVDTGDATTFGDEGSMRAALERLQRWQGILGNCRARLLFGNHDAWTGDQPFFDSNYAKAIVAQRKLIDSFPPWRTSQWLQPLSIAAGRDGPRIECYALDSVSFRQWKNARAVGYIRPGTLEWLRDTIDQSSSRGSYRILLTHHPMSFPYTWPERLAKTVLPLWELGNARRVARALGCDSDLARIDGQPYIHLFLSGHTHGTYPAEKLPDNVNSIYSPPLGQGQLQLVTGPLMLVRSRKRARSDAETLATGGNAAAGSSDSGEVTRRPSGDFSLTSVCEASQQFQLLRFYSNKDRPGQLKLERKVYMRTPNDDGFAERASWTSETRVFC